MYTFDSPPARTAAAAMLCAGGRYEMVQEEEAPFASPMSLST